MRLRGLLLFYLFFSAAFAKTQAQTLPRYSAAQADSTVLELYEALVNYHPFTHRAQGRSQLDSVLLGVRRDVALRAATDSITMATLIAATAPIRTLIGDGHLQLRPVRTATFRKAQVAHQYGVELRRSDDGTLLVGRDYTRADSTVLPKGAQVLTLQGRPVNELIPEIATFSGVDDHDLRAAREYYPARSLLEFYQRLYGYQDSLLLATTAAGDTTSFYVYPKAPTATLRRRDRPSKRQQLAQVISLDTTTDARIRVLTIHSFSKSELGKGNARKWVRRLYKDVQQSNDQALIIDVRNNTGGSASLVDEVFRFVALEPFRMVDSMIGYTPRVYGKHVWSRPGAYLFGGIRHRGKVWIRRGARKVTQPHHRRHFDGPVAVLTNEITFSGGSSLAHYVQHYQRGVVVGQTTGGSAERMYAGDLIEVLIGPRKELRINMPLYYMDMVGDARGNVAPDLLIPRTRDNQLDDLDLSLQTAVEYLRKEVNTAAQL